MNFTGTLSIKVYLGRRLPLLACMKVPKSEKLFGYFLLSLGEFPLDGGGIALLPFPSHAHVRIHTFLVIIVGWQIVSSCDRLEALWGVTFCHIGEGLREGERCARAEKGEKWVKGSGGYGKEKEGETSVFRGQGSKNAAEGAGNRGYFGNFFFRETLWRKCLIDKMS